MLGLREVSAVIALFVVLVCEQALAAGGPGLSDTDKPVAVTVVRKKVSTSLIGSCSTTKTSFNVRIQSIKSKTTSFSRVLMNMNTIETNASKLGNGTATDIGICAEMADQGGFAGFSFIDGLCKMFSPGRQPCKCDAGTGDLIYARDSFWDKQDRVLLKLVPVEGELMEYVNFPRTVFDQKNNTAGRFFSYNDVGFATDADLAGMFSLTPENIAVSSRGDKSYMTTIVDTEHCSMGCNSSSNFIVRQLFTVNQQVIDKIMPRTFFLSECGHTVSLNGSVRAQPLMSHKGYGCRWYTKEAEDHECVVTLTFGPSMSRVAVTFYASGLDGNSSTCEGDSLAFYSGTPGIGTLVKNATSCSKEKDLKFPVASSEIVLVFRRSSKQHQPNGFNLGFMMMLNPS